MVEQENTTDDSIDDEQEYSEMEKLNTRGVLITDKAPFINDKYNYFVEYIFGAVIVLLAFTNTIINTPPNQSVRLLAGLGLIVLALVGVMKVATYFPTSHQLNRLDYLQTDEEYDYEEIPIVFGLFDGFVYGVKLVGFACVLFFIVYAIGIIVPPIIHVIGQYPDVLTVPEIINEVMNPPTREALAKQDVWNASK